MSTSLADVVMVAIGDRDRASSRLRVHSWADRFSANGVHCQVLTYYDPAWMRRSGLSPRYPRLAAAFRARRFWNRLLHRAEGAGAVLLQEVVPPIEVTRALGRCVRRMVVDLSDPIHLAAPGQSALSRLYHRTVVLPRLEVLVRTAQSTLVENERVGAWVAERGGRVEIVRGPVDIGRHRPRRSPPARAGRITLGWTGSRATLPYLESIQPVLKELCVASPEVEVVLFGVPEAPASWRVAPRVTPWSEAAEPDVVSSFDIGLNPLPDSDWGRLRGGAKVMIYLASGVPVVSSGSGIADQVLESGRTGLIARDTAEWRDALARLIGDPDLRRRMGAAARAEAVSRYSYEVYQPLMERLLLGAGQTPAAQSGVERSS